MPDAVKSKRVVTFVPAEQAETFAKTIADEIPYLFGGYDAVCWWNTPKTEEGTEQFRRRGGTLEQTPSVRMEFSIPDDVECQEKFTKTIQNLHPWEEPVILFFDSEIIRKK